MKVDVSDDEWRLLDSAVLRGALEGALASTALAVPSFYYLYRKSPWYRSLPLPLRVAGVVMIVAPVTSIQAERRSLAFERKRWCVVFSARGFRCAHLCMTGPIRGNWSSTVQQRKRRPGSRRSQRQTRCSTGPRAINTRSFSGAGRRPWPSPVPL